MANLLIGLGGTGGKVLKAFRQRIWTEFDPKERERLPLGYIYVDSDRAMLDPNDLSYQTIHGNCCFENKEFVDIKTDSNIDAIFSNPRGYTRLTGPLGNVGETQSAVCPVGAAADQKRRAGRLLFGANIDGYLSALASAIEELNRKEVGGKLNIMIYTGLAGGTGSGSIVDCIVQTRKWLFEHSISEQQFTITVFCQLPENTPKPNWDTGRYKANGYAALLELNNLFTSHYNVEWGTRVSVPPYDVTSSVEEGRVYLTYNNATPDNIRKGAIPQDVKIAGGLILYSNKNEFGYTITEPEELAGLVADMTYVRIFTPNDAMGQELNRFATFENLASNRDEYDETADPEEGSPLPVRTRAIGSFGIKRIVVPETELKEHVAYYLGLAALYQFKYDNWSESVGFRNEAKPFDPLSYVKNDGRREAWKMSADQLRLKLPIIEGDTKEGWPTGGFSKYWDPCVDRWAAAAKGTEHPFDKLIELCRGGYESGFRSSGVDNFFTDKDRAREIYAKAIAESAEKYLFREWADGRLSLVDARQVVGILTKQMREEARIMTEEQLPAMDAKVKEYEQMLNGIKAEYLNTNILKRQIIFGNRFERFTHYCKLLYVEKTEVASIRYFAHPLTQELERRFKDLQERLLQFENAVDQIIDFAKERMTTLADLQTANETDGTETMTEPIVKFYSRSRMIDLENRLSIDKERMSDITATIRAAIVSGIQSDGRFVNARKLSPALISAALLGSVYSHIVIFHNDLTAGGEKVLGVPILERLSVKFGNNDLAIGQFADKIVRASGVFSELNMNEIRLNNANTPAPEIGKNILFKRILITLPKVDDTDLMEFAQKLTDKFKSAIPANSGAAVIVSNEGSNPNEITVTVLDNGFPMRAIGSMPMLKAEFDRLITQNPLNAVVLSTEGKSTDYRSLFARPAKTPEEIRQEVMPMAIIALGLGKLQVDRENTNQFGAAGAPDFLGNSTIEPWGYEKFTEMVYDDRLIEQRAKEITRMANEALSERMEGLDPSQLNAIRDKRKEIDAEMLANVGAIINGEKLPRGQRYNEFIKWIGDAKALVAQAKP